MTTEPVRERKTRIRPMEHEDIADVLAIDRRITGIRRAITYTDLITGDLGRLLDLSFVAEVNGHVAGFVLARHSVGAFGEAGYLNILGVDPDYWQQGIGSKLIDALRERARSKGLKTIRVMLNERDKKLQGFFQHVGFHRGQLIDYTLSP